MARKQKELPGMEKPTIKELDTAAEEYREKMLKRKKAGEAEKTAKSALIAAMKKHGQDVYRDESVTPALVVVLVPGEDGVKVTEANEGESESEAA